MICCRQLRPQHLQRNPGLVLRAFECGDFLLRISSFLLQLVESLSTMSILLPGAGVCCAFFLMVLTSASIGFAKCWKPADISSLAVASSTLF